MEQPLLISTLLTHAERHHGEQEDRLRTHKWLPLDGALSATKHLEIQELLGVRPRRTEDVAQA